MIVAAFICSIYKWVSIGPHQTAHRHLAGQEMIYEFDEENVLEKNFDEVAANVLGMVPTFKLA